MVKEPEIEKLSDSLTFGDFLLGSNLLTAGFAEY